MVAIVGASGSGKSTLLNIIGCMDVMTEGEYLFEGNAIHQMKTIQRQKFAKENVSFIFQNFALMPGYTVYENVELPLRIKNMHVAEQCERRICLQDGRIIG